MSRFRFCLLSLSLCLAACSDAPPRAGAKSPVREEPSESQADSAEKEESSPTSAGRSRSEASTGQCDSGCQQLIESADKLLHQAEALKAGSKAKLALYERAGQASVNAWRGCDLSQPRGQDLVCTGARTVADIMAKAFLGAEREDRASYAYLVAHDPRYKVEGGEAASRAESELGRLAEAAENRAKNQPKAAGAGAGLAAAAYARLALGDGDQAGRDAVLLRQTYARELPEEVSLVAAALGTRYADQDSWEKAMVELPAASAPAGNVPSRVRILWHAARGRALAGLGRGPAAASEFQQVLATWHPPAAKETEQMLGRAEPAPMLGRESVVDAVGAAHFFFGEQPRTASERLSMPKYSGPATAGGVGQYVKGQVAEWIGKKQKLITDAEARYRAIAAIKPVPPARWLVAGAAMTARAYTNFADDFANAKLPEKLEQDQDVRSAFAKALSDAEKPLREKAKKSLEFCKSAADKAGLGDQERAVCDDSGARRP